jgi:hypothetical protein
MLNYSEMWNTKAREDAGPFHCMHRTAVGPRTAELIGAGGVGLVLSPDSGDQ